MSCFKLFLIGRNVHNLVCNKLHLYFQSIGPRQKSISVASYRKINRTTFGISNYGTLISCIFCCPPELLCTIFGLLSENFRRSEYDALSLNSRKVECVATIP